MALQMFKESKVLYMLSMNKLLPALVQTGSLTQNLMFPGKLLDLIQGNLAKVKYGFQNLVEQELLTLHLIHPQLLVGFMLLNLYFSV